MHGYYRKEKNEISESLCSRIRSPKQALRKENMLLLCFSAIRKLRHGRVTDLLQITLLDSTPSTRQSASLNPSSAEFSAKSSKGKVQPLYLFSSRYAWPSWRGKMRREK